MSDWLKKLFSILFPKDIKCICCEAELQKSSRFCMCENCLNNLPFIGEHFCKKCGEKLSSLSNVCLSCKDHSERYFTFNRSVFCYEGVIKKLIFDLKYNNAKWLGEYLGRFLVDEYLKMGIKADYIIPIPLNKNRLKQRGYNQSEVISKPFETELGIKLETQNFIRTIDTPTQTNLTKKERETNLLGAFEVLNKDIFKNKTILLVDDVFTTGSTMEEASKTLLKAKAKAVYTLTLAHTQRPIITEGKDK